MPGYWTLVAVLCRQFYIAYWNVSSGQCGVLSCIHFLNYRDAWNDTRYVLYKGLSRSECVYVSCTCKPKWLNLFSLIPWLVKNGIQNSSLWVSFGDNDHSERINDRFGNYNIFWTCIIIWGVIFWVSMQRTQTSHNDFCGSDMSLLPRMLLT